MKRVNSWTRAAEIVAHAKKQVKTVTDDCAKRADGDDVLATVRNVRSNRVIFALAELDDKPHPDRVRATAQTQHFGGREVQSHYNLTFRCNECCQMVEEAVELDNVATDGPDGVEVRLCLKCLMKAVMLLDT